MTEELTITNVNKRRKWGWGYSFSPTGNGTEIKPPETPDYEGTFGQIAIARSRDPILKAHSNCFSSFRWFWDGKPIIATWSYDVVSSEWSGDYEEEEVFEYGWAWFDGFQYPLDGVPVNEIRIRVE